MMPVGQVFRPKISFKSFEGELTPSFDSVLKDWISNARRSGFADPGYVLEITYLTPPLRAFVERIAERLEIPGVIGGPLERGLGFGKTHSLIFLWHMFTSDIYGRIEGISVDEDVVKETLVLGMDCSKDKPLARMVEELKAYTDVNHHVARMKDPRLIRAVGEVLKNYRRELYGLSSEELAELISEVIRRYGELGGRPRLLLLIDELGWGLAQKLRSYTDKVGKEKRSEAESIYNEANALVNFLSYLYAKLHGMPVKGVVIWVLAEQDRKEIETLAIKHQDNEVVYNKVKGLLDDLSIIAERYSRGLGGTGLAELSYSPGHALEIARYRILRVVEGVELAKLQDEYVKWLDGLARQLNLTEAFARFREETRRYYPFSLGLINLLKKLMSSRDVPATEFVRTVIMVAGKAAQKALSLDPEASYTIGVKHLSIPWIVLPKVMGEFGVDWADAAGDIELALSKIESDKREAAEIAAKYVLAKGVTANIIAALESRERRVVERYGSTVDEIQLEILETFPENDALQIIEKLGEALERLRAESARIDEREVGERRYYLPSLFKTVYNKLASYILEERKNLENRALIPIYIKQTGTIPSLFYNIRVAVAGRSGDVDAMLTEYRKVKDIDILLSDPSFQEAQNKGRLLLILVPPWDMELFNEIYLTNIMYEGIVKSLAEKLQHAVEQGRIKRPLHVVVLLPDLSAYRVNRILDKLAVYEGTKKFLNYLSRKEDVINERLREYEDTFVKRKDLSYILSEDIRRRHLRELRSRVEREMADARSFAQKQLVRLSREITADVLELYRTAVYYSIDRNGFTVREVRLGEPVRDMGAHEGGAAVSNLSQYASIVNKFLASIVRELAYEYNSMKIMRALMESYRREFEQGVAREHDRISEVLENIMLGTYGVKPLSLNVAREAVKILNNQTIELDDKNIVITLDESSDLIRINVERRVEEERGGPAAGLIETAGIVAAAMRPSMLEHRVQHVSLELPPGFAVDDIRSRLTTLMNLLSGLDAEITTFELRLETTSISLSVSIKNLDIKTLSDSNVRTVVNLLSRISSRENKSVSIDMYISKPIEEDKVREVFGEYLGASRSSFDKLLPM